MIHYNVKNYSIVGFKGDTPVVECVGEYDLILVKDASANVQPYRWLDKNHNMLLPCTFESPDIAKKWLNSAKSWLVSYVVDNGTIE